ncbi:MAG: hypothetical protein NTX88_10905 [Candidatus Atribacteria bacterium]|nr:hypothetical protein [Candidatus Atribacteria bacterium]
MMTIEQRLKKLEAQTVSHRCDAVERWHITDEATAREASLVFERYSFSPALIDLAFQAREFYRKSPGKELPEGLTTLWNEELLRLTR